MKRIFYNIKSMFKSSSKTRRNLLLTVVALIEVFLIAIVSTFAWVEKISSIDIKTRDKESAAVAAKPMTVANVNNTNTSIDLTQYFRASGNVHLASASSADGENIFFRNVSSENASPAYRKGNINDINVNYISFSFKIKASTKDRDFCFEQAPTIKIGETTLNDASVRMAISTNTEKTPKVFSMQKITDNDVIADTDGNYTTNSVTVHSFADYSSNGDGNIFTIKGTTSNTYTEVFVSLWLEDPTGSTKYSGDLSIENLKIIQPTTLTVHIISNASENTTGGTVTIDGTTVMDKDAVKKIRVNSDGTTQVTLQANKGENAKFVGWYGNKNATGDQLWDDNPHKLTVSQNMDVYAIFYKQVTINLRTSPINITNLKVGFDTGVLKDNTDTNSTHYYNDNVTIKADDSLVSNYAFTQWSTSSTGGTQISTSPNYSYHISSDGPINLYAQFEKAYTVTANTAVISSTGNVSLKSITSGGKIYMTGELSSAAAGEKTKKLTATQSVTFTATSPTSTNYKFMGWYSTSGNSETPLSTASTYTVRFSDLTASKTIYARYGQATSYYLKGSFNSWAENKDTAMYRVSRNEMSATLTLTADVYEFKINNHTTTSNVWYSTNKEYVNETVNESFSDTKDNSKLIVTKDGNYTFTLDNNLNLTITPPKDIGTLIVFKDGTSDNWLKNADATIYMKFSDSTEVKMLTADSKEWFASLPSTKTISRFERRDPSGTYLWHYWQYSRPSNKTVFNATAATNNTSNGTGSWTN